MKGCLTALAVMFGLFLVIVIGATMFNGNQAPTNSEDSSSSGTADFSKPRPSRKHGWVTAAALGQTLDFWDSPQAECDGMEAAAQELVSAQQEGREPDPQFASHLPGRRDIGTGIRVEIVGHDSNSCHGTETDFTRVRVVDRDSNLNGRIGYLVEGRLSKQ